MRDLNRFDRQIDTEQVVCQNNVGECLTKGRCLFDLAKYFEVIGDTHVVLFQQVIGRHEKRAVSAGGVAYGYVAQGGEEIHPKREVPSIVDTVAALVRVDTVFACQGGGPF